MWTVLSELVTYLIKFIAMLLCAFLGILVGKKVRESKDIKLSAGNAEK